MRDLKNLYRQIIMDHYKNPRHKGLTSEEGYIKEHIKNPSCGDDITIQSKIEDNTVKDIRHEGTGCSICCSSASVLATLLKDKSVAEAQTFTRNYINMITNQSYDKYFDFEDAIAYQGVKDFPARTKCATIAWLAFEQTLKKQVK